MKWKLFWWFIRYCFSRDWFYLITQIFKLNLITILIEIFSDTLEISSPVLLLRTFMRKPWYDFTLTRVLLLRSLQRYFSVKRMTYANNFAYAFFMHVTGTSESNLCMYMPFRNFFRQLIFTITVKNYPATFLFADAAINCDFCIFLNIVCWLSKLD